MATPSRIDPELRAEIERQLVNHRSSIRESHEALGSLVAAARQHHQPVITLSNFASHASPCLVSGLAMYALEGDFDAASQEFSAFGDWFVLYEELLGAADRGALAGLEPRFQLRDLLESTMCLVLADDRARLARLAGPQLEQLFVLPDAIRQNKVGQAWAWFSYALLVLARGKPSVELADQIYAVRPKDVIAGYDALLREALRGDATAFEAQRQRLETAYPSRGTKLRSSVINWEGAGRIGQAMTFDVVGTVISRLAVLSGFDLEIDSSLYPGAFMHRDAARNS